MHVAKVHQLDEVAVEVAREEERVAAGRALGLAHALHALAHEVVVPPLRVSYVE